MSYQEGSNWQARKEDEKKPLYETKQPSTSPPPTTEQSELWNAFLKDAEKLLYAINAETISENSAIDLLREKYSITRKQEVPEAVSFAEWCVELYGWSDTDEIWVDNPGEKYSSMELYEIFKKQKS